METKLKVISPRYQQIAADIAAKIVEKRYQIGEKIYTRSVLSSQYSVSPETARRAISILSDLEIVESIKGSGVVIKSYEKALNFVRQYNDIQTVKSIKNNIRQSIGRQTKEISHLHELLENLINQTERFRTLNPFIPFEMEITNQAQCLDKSVADTNFWHNTGATIIAIKRNNSILISPGPYSTFQAGDILYFIGNEDVLQRVQLFIYASAKSQSVSLPVSC